MYSPALTSAAWLGILSLRCSARDRHSRDAPLATDIRQGTGAKSACREGLGLHPVTGTSVNGVSNTAYNHGDDLFVTDRTGGRVLQIAAAGDQLDAPRLVADGLAGPEGIDVGPDGRLYVVEADAARVTAIEPASGAKTVLADGLEIHVPTQGASPESWIFNGIAAGAGKVYVSGDRGERGV